MIKKILLLALLASNGAIAATQLTTAEQSDMIAAHTKWRTAVNVPALKWSATLADKAQAWADSLKTNKACQMQHSGTAGLGENLYWASALMYSDGTKKAQVISSTQVTDSWGNESKDYTYSTNTCAAGKVCGHYTQVVWKATTEVGCGKAICADNSQIWVCNYTPQGNFVGQKPY